VLERQGVPRNLFTAVQVDAPGLPLQVDHGQIRRVGELDDDERPAGRGVRPSGEGQYLKVDVALAIADIDEVMELGPHDVPVAHHLPQGRLTKDRPELEWMVVTSELVLPGEADPDELLVLVWALFDQAGRGDSPRVVPGLQQPGQELRVVRADGGAGASQLGKVRVRIATNVARRLPPAILPGLVSDGKQRVALQLADTVLSQELV
jgi:hypothetical protein